MGELENSPTHLRTKQLKRTPLLMPPRIHPTKQDQYTAYIGFYKHYSTLIFRARISIFTLIFVSLGFLIKIIPTLEKSQLEFKILHSVVSQEALVAYITSLLIGILFLLETAYYRRFLGIITCLNQIEREAKLCRGEDDKSSFFRQYNRRHHEYSIFYLISCLFLNIFFVYENKSMPLISIICAFASISFLMFIYLFILKRIFSRFKEEIMGTALELP